MNYKDIYRRPPISDKGYVIKFGKHRGLTIEQLMDDDPQYLQFCLDKDILELDHILLDMFEEKNPWMADDAPRWEPARATIEDDPR